MNTLLNKYKPVYLDDFEHNKSKCFLTIKKLIDNDTLNILLIGKECSGKTTIINSIVKEYYKNITYSEQNILRINILKEHGLNYYKSEVKTFCQSNVKQKKVIILDDFCSISEEGQLYFKFLIEKYKNIHFIASTTHLHKISKYIISYFFEERLPLYSKAM
jgi:GTPase SAR1 family protein